MKKAILLIAGCFAAFHLNAQTWTWANPLPQGNTLNCVQHISNQTFYAAGSGGCFMKTTNNGLSWELRGPLSSESILCIFFRNENLGFAGGTGGLLLKTSDGGNTWNSLTSGTTQNINAIFFTDQDTGFFTGDGTTIRKTTNAGTTWLPSASGLSSFSEDIFDIEFLNPDTGCVVGSGGLIARTINGGSNWSAITSPLSDDLHGIHIAAPQQWHVCGYWGALLKSQDFGLSWNVQTATGNNYFNSIRFTNATSGYAAANEGLFYTADGGSNWLQYPVSTGEYFLGMVPGTGSNLLAVGAAGNIWKSSNSGATWQGLPNDITNKAVLRSIAFSGPDTGFICGNKGHIIRTTDGGLNWDSVSVSLYSQSQIVFTTPLTGYAVGGTFILKTTDRGQSWTLISTGSAQALNSVFFVSPDTGYVCGNGGTIMKTVNAGQTWTPLNSGTTQVLYRIRFVNSSIGIACGASGTIRRTTDGGQNWSAITSPVTAALMDINFLSPNTGLICGTSGKLIKTTNGGQNWTSITSGTSRGLYSIFFKTADTGYIAGDGNTLLKTTNAGSSWSLAPVPAANGFKAVYFNSRGTGFLAGNHGSILTTLTPLPVGISADPSSAILSGRAEVFPNPSRGILRVALPDHEKYKIEIYNLSGQLMLCLTTEDMRELMINTGDFKSGMYMMVVAGNSWTQTLKLILEED